MVSVDVKEEVEGRKLVAGTPWKTWGAILKTTAEPGGSMGSKVAMDILEQSWHLDP